MLGEKAILGESMAIDRLRLGDNSELFPRTRSKVWLIDNRIMQKVQASSTKFPTGTHTHSESTSQRSLYELHL